MNATVLVVVIVVLAGLIGERMWHGNFSQAAADITEPGRVTGVLVLVMLAMTAFLLMALIGGRS